ncbi:UNVERIFIED_CONTAM: RHS repeat-associated protein [Acetivibrio alkalicellulosi]
MTKEGNQIRVRQIDGGITEVIAEYKYDPLNRLIETVTDAGTVTFAYNGEGRRVEKSTGSETTYYLYEYDKVVLEVDGNENQIARNLYGINLLMRDVDGDSYYYVYNGHADVTALINANTGNVDATYYYDPFGNILESTGNVNNNITYAGYQYDEETGLYYLNARMYDPKIARFLQEDTYRGDINDPLSLNLYVYCANNPITYYDPTGHFWQRIKKGTEWVQDKSIQAKDAVVETVSNVWDTTTDYVSAGYNHLIDKTNNAVSLIKNVANIADEIVKEWDWNSTEPPLKKYGVNEIPSSGDMTSNFASSLTGDFLGIVSELDNYDKALHGYIRDNNMIQILPKNNIATYKPYEKFAKSASKVGTAITITTNTLDVLNTWTADSGNTNTKRVQKTAIQLGGTLTSLGVGYGTGKLVAKGIGGAKVTAGLSLGVIPVAIGLNYGTSWLIDKGQNYLYKKYDIK